MREVLSELLDAWQSGRPVGLATVIASWQSAPRPAGATMLVDSDGRVTGSVSGGCVEGAVYDLAQQVIDNGGSVLERFGVSDDDAFSVGLSCGGILDIFVDRVDQESFPELGAVLADIDSGRPVAVATLVEHPDASRIGHRLIVHPTDVNSREGAPLALSGSLGSVDMDAAVAEDARGALEAGLTKTLTYGPEGERLKDGARVFVASYAPRPRMIVFGAVDFALALSKVASFLGYHVTVCDARAVFTTPSRFPDADDVVVDWPHRYLDAESKSGRIDGRTVLAILTHDPKFDVPLLEVALRLPEVQYIGAMGSRRTHDLRLSRLRAGGLTEPELSRMSSPIGLDLGASTPEETAVSIVAEIIAMRWGGGGSRLSNREGPIHHHAIS